MLGLGGDCSSVDVDVTEASPAEKKGRASSVRRAPSKLTTPRPMA
jgi:hypothetical protein